jgi:hypothetical protein
MSYPPISDKSNQIWTFASATDLREMEWAVEHQGDGCFIIDPVVAQNGLTHLVAKRCDDKGVPCVIAYTDGRDDMSKVDMARLDRVLAMTDKIALTTSHINEWSPIHPVSHWTDFAKSKGFQWCCAYIHVRLLEDLKAKVVQEQLLRDNTPVFCLCAYMLTQYACGYATPTYQTALSGRDLAGEGLAGDLLEAYFSPLIAFSGGGGQKGIDRGTRQSTALCGLNGIVAAGPLERFVPEDLPTMSYKMDYRDLVDPTWT